MKIYNNALGLVLFFSLLCGQQLDARLEVFDGEYGEIELLNTLKARFCYIVFFKMGREHFLVKQKKSDFLRKIVSVVRDSTTAHLAESFGIAHRVDVIPAHKKFPGKPRLDWPATIHTVAPGKMIKAQNSEYNRMNIKQANIGFRREMLHWMAKHPVLTMIVALDTFSCNHDRHRGNLFYESKTDSFCAIDMDSAWKYNLCSLACKNFSAMLHDRHLRLSNKEIKTLKLYKEYLEFLIDKHHPEDTIAMYDYFAEKAGFVKGTALYTQKVELELERNRRMIRESYKDVQRLIGILEQLIKVSKKQLKSLGYSHYYFL